MTDVEWMTSKKIFSVKFNENMKDMFELIHKTKSTFDGASNIDFNRIGCSNPKNYFKWLSIYYMDIDQEYYVKHEPNKLLMESQKYFHYNIIEWPWFIFIFLFSIFPSKKKQFCTQWDEVNEKMTRKFIHICMALDWMSHSSRLEILILFVCFEREKIMYIKVMPQCALGMRNVIRIGRFSMTSGHFCSCAEQIINTSQEKSMPKSLWCARQFSEPHSLHFRQYD